MVQPLQQHLNAPAIRTALQHRGRQSHMYPIVGALINRSHSPQTLSKSEALLDRRLCVAQSPVACSRGIEIVSVSNPTFFGSTMSSMVVDPSEKIPAQAQMRHPGVEADMEGPKPQYYSEKYVPAGKLEGKVAIVTGGDSGIGRSVCVLYAAEGAEAVILVYKAAEEDVDGEFTVKEIERVSKGKCKAKAIRLDLGLDENCKQVVDTVVKEFGRIDVLVNNASEQFYKESIEEIEPDQLERTFRSNIFSMFFLTRHAVKHMKEGSCIINTTSITTYMGAPMLLDYSSTKGAILAFTRGLALQLVKRGIRVNGVAPGPIWTPLIPASFPAEQTEGGQWGTGMVPMGRVGQPFECGTAYVFLASEDSSYFAGQVLHPNGGAVVNA